MLRATGGINTHKGAIFTLGTVCAAVGRLWRPEAPCQNPERIAETCAALCAQAVEEDLARVKETGSPRTAGERLYLQYGLRGIRGEAAAGLPAVREAGLPLLETCLAEGLSRNDAGAVALLYLIARGEDTNMIKRGGPALAGQAVALIAEEVRRNSFPPMERIRELDAFFIRHGLSPGGCADLLAVSYFLHDWKTDKR